MTVRDTAFWIIGCVVWGNAIVGGAQTPSGYSQVQDRTVAPASPTPGSYQRLSGRNNPALSFFGGGRTFNYGQQRVSTATPAARPVNTTPLGKPFSGVRQAPNVTPYLALDAIERDAGVPNYYTFVRPQLEQQQWNQVQQTDYRRLQQQVRVATAGAAIIAPSPSGGIPTTGHSSQFMNSSGYYPGLR